MFSTFRCHLFCRSSTSWQQKIILSLCVWQLNASKCLRILQSGLSEGCDHCASECTKQRIVVLSIIDIFLYSQQTIHKGNPIHFLRLKQKADWQGSLTFYPWQLIQWGTKRSEKLLPMKKNGGATNVNIEGKIIFKVDFQLKTFIQIHILYLLS